VRTTPAEEAALRAMSALSAWATKASVGIGAAVIDLETGNLIGDLDAHRPRNPASNAKILTAAAVLDRFGPDHRFTTGVYGKIEGGVCGALALRGDGDPSLETDELWQLASALYDQGLRRVDAIYVDQSRFDGQFVPPAFEQQQDEWAPFRAPVSAVALERNAVTLHVAPSRKGTPATIWFDPPGFVEVRGSIETREAEAGNGTRLTLTPSGGRLVADVGGYIGEGTPRVRVGKRVDDPRVFAGYALSALLRRMGVEVRGAVALGGEQVRSRLAYVESMPISVLVHELGKNSDNFYAEMLLKNLGGLVSGGPARTEDGAKDAVAYLGEVGAKDPGTRVSNGSGLFDANRLSPWSLARVLQHAYESPKIAPEFVSELAVGGVDGTLKSRFKKRARERAVRAKSGTLDRVIALSGYILAPGGRRPLAFSFIAEGVAGKHAEVRDQLDRAVEALAAALR
jgi:D-alanyl-D-alanine carboxypeptidase/D-alanyl-D-alanine-endopeptidase (penicillin-binding protein 4)